MREKRQFKRKLLNFSVKRDMQFRMIGRIFLLLFISLLLSSLIFYFFAHREIGGSFQMFHVKARNFLDFLLPAVIGSFFISLLVGAIGSLFFPKSIVGGLHRIEEDLKEMTEQGDLTLQIKMREGDQVAPLAAQINTLQDKYRGQISRIDQALEELERYVENESATAGSGNLEAAGQACRQLRAELQKLHY